MSFTHHTFIESTTQWIRFLRHSLKLLLIPLINCDGYQHFSRQDIRLKCLIRRHEDPTFADSSFKCAIYLYGTSWNLILFPALRLKLHLAFGSRVPLYLMYLQQVMQCLRQDILSAWCSIFWQIFYEASFANPFDEKYFNEVLHNQTLA